jgi:CopG family nickel-responsive transcriptional regulator
MSSSLVRFGLAIDAPLLAQVDALVDERGCTRSELFRDLARAEVARGAVTRGVDAVATLTLVYDHHVRDLSEKLTELQHELGEQVRSTLHVHLSHDYCLEVIVLRGRSDKLRAIADRILATRGVKQGGIEIVTSVFQNEHAHPHGHAASDQKPRARKRKRGGRGAQRS